MKYLKHELITSIKPRTFVWYSWNLYILISNAHSGIHEWQNAARKTTNNSNGQHQTERIQWCSIKQWKRRIIEDVGGMSLRFGSPRVCLRSSGTNRTKYPFLPELNQNFQGLSVFQWHQSKTACVQFGRKRIFLSDGCFWPIISRVEVSMSISSSR